MTGPFATAIIIVALVLALWALVLLIRGLPPSLPLVAGAAVLEVMLIAFLVGGIVQMAGSDHDLARAEFVGYLLACTVVVPGALWWVRDEESRAASAVMAVVFVLLPILVIRVQQVWSGVSA